MQRNMDFNSIAESHGHKGYAGSVKIRRVWAALAAELGF